MVEVRSLRAKAGRETRAEQGAEQKLAYTKDCRCGPAWAESTSLQLKCRASATLDRTASVIMIDP